MDFSLKRKGCRQRFLSPYLRVSNLSCPNKILFKVLYIVFNPRLKWWLKLTKLKQSKAFISWVLLEQVSSNGPHLTTWACFDELLEPSFFKCLSELWSPLEQASPINKFWNPSRMRLFNQLLYQLKQVMNLISSKYPEMDQH